MYKEAWQPVTGELLLMFSKSNNRHDRREVAICLDGGHVPRERLLSSVYSNFVKNRACA